MNGSDRENILLSVEFLVVKGSILLRLRRISLFLYVCTYILVHLFGVFFGGGRGGGSHFKGQICQNAMIW